MNAAADAESNSSKEVGGTTKEATVQARPAPPVAAIPAKSGEPEIQSEADKDVKAEADEKSDSGDSAQDERDESEEKVRLGDSNKLEGPYGELAGPNFILGEPDENGYVGVSEEYKRLKGPEAAQNPDVDDSEDNDES